MSHRQNLKNLSILLTRIHKSLLDHQFISVQSSKRTPLGPSDKLQMLLHDPDFQWLRPLSQLISTVDGVVFQKEDVTLEQHNLMISQIHDMFSDTSEFYLRYLHTALHLPDVQTLLQSLKTPLN